MNFLAHIYLSDGDPDVTVGNFIADGIKGKDYLNFPIDIRRGILLHRAIDSFTDSHPTVRQGTRRLHEGFGHYSGVIVDVFYDHFLAKNWTRYSPEPLESFIDNFYKLMTERHDKLPPRIQQLMPYMVADNWLLSYARVEGIEKILTQMSRRVKGGVLLHPAVTELRIHYADFESEFTSFFEELRVFCRDTLRNLRNDIR